MFPEHPLRCRQRSTGAFDGNELERGILGQDDRGRPLTPAAIGEDDRQMVARPPPGDDCCQISERSYTRTVDLPDLVAEIEAGGMNRRAEWRRRKGPKQQHWRDRYRELAHRPTSEAKVPDAADQLRTAMERHEGVDEDRAAVTAYAEDECDVQLDATLTPGTTSTKRMIAISALSPRRLPVFKMRV